MHVLLNAISAVSGGAISYLRNLTPLLAEQFENPARRNRLTILAHESQRGLLQDVSEDNCIWLDGEKPSGWRRLVWEKNHIEKIIRQYGVDVLFTPYQVSTGTGLARQVLMLRNMEPFLHSGYHYSLRSRIRNEVLCFASSRSLRRADRVIAVSEFARRRLEGALKIPEMRIRTIYHGRTEQLSQPSASGRDQKLLSACGVTKPFLLTCGSMLPYRRCEDVIAAFGESVPRLPGDTQLIIAGAGSDADYTKKIQTAVADSDYRDRIRLLGHVPFGTMAALYRNCAFCIIATEIEACPNIAIEAMTAGCVILSSDKDPLPEIFDGAALEYQARNVEDLAEAIVQLSDDLCVQEKMREKARQRALSFSWEKCARETYDALTNW